MTPNEFVKHCQFLGQQDALVDYKAIVHDIMVKANGVKLSPERDSDYLETHYLISVFLDANEFDNRTLCDIREEYGTGGLWEKAESLTDEFHLKYNDTIWGEELDYHDTLEEFLKEKLP